MELDRVRVRNFRSIKDTGWVDIEDDLTTLLGKNESGKTAFLEAIEEFGTDDEYDSTDIHADFEPELVKPFPVTTLEFSLGDLAPPLKAIDEKFERLDAIRITKYQFPHRPGGTAHKITKVKKSVRAKSISEHDFVDIQFGKDLLKCLDADLDAVEDVPDGVQDQFSRLKNQVVDVLSTDTIIPEAFLDAIYDIAELLELVRLHAFPSTEWNHPVYIDLIEQHFQPSDREEYIKTGTVVEALPPIIHQNQQDIIQDEVRQHSLGSDDHRTFTNLFKLTDLDIDEFKQKEFKNQRVDANRVSDEIRVHMNEYWDQKTVDVDLGYNGNKFVILIEDTVLNGTEEVNREPLPPSQRSKGFQWFLSFYINFKCEAGKSSENSILLLDDPAVYLHPEGKKNWLSAVESVADDNQVIYTSHSPYLIRKEYPERIRIVEDMKDEGTQITSDFIESSESSLEPLREALGIGLGDTPFAAKRKILVEGPSDYYILTGLAHYSKEWGDDILEWDDLSLMVMDGANKMVDVAKWVASEGFDYALLLDNDEQGKEVETEIDEHHDEIRDGEVVLLDKPDGPDYHVEIEDMFPPTFYVDCVNVAYDEILDDFDPIEISENGDGWDIEGAEYEGRKIVSVLDDIFDDRGDGDFDNKVVAKEIMRQLKAGDVSESHIEAFKPILGKLNAAT